MPNNKKNPKPKRNPTVDETNAALAIEFAEPDTKEKDPLSEKSGSDALESSKQSNSSEAEKAGEMASEVNAMGSDGRPLHEPEGIFFPKDSQETDENAHKLLTRLMRDSEKRFQNPPLLLDDLKGLGMCGDLSDDHRLVTMSFADAHQLKTNMKMSEIILNERIQNKRKVKVEFLKAQINAANGNNVSTLLEQLEKAKAALAQKHSFQSVGVYGDDPVIDIEGIIFFETLLLARAIDWLAMLSIDPDSEARRGTLAVFS